ncbi:NB-ARC domain-containing protein [Nocardia sp. NPDC051570]|uniref:NB-ARC domain-containing protein n=1 Tax=Nocardia sp. NPDC051570 TaxID=3364324 RepID=UPI0037BC74BD
MSVPSQIPPRNGNFVDRETVFAAVRDYVTATTGNVTVVVKGMPRVGKTAAVTEWMHRFHGNYRDGQLFCQLTESTVMADVLLDVLVALGDPRDGVPDRAEARRNRYLTLTRGRRLLVVIDGAVTAAQVAWLEPADGSSLVIVTGRNSASDLSRGGRVFELGPLPSADARDLFVRIVGVDRAAAEPEAVERIRILCGNMPFALCVVGSMLAQRCEQRIGQLADLLSDDDRRSAVLSLPEIFGAAYDSLSETAQRCYRVLGLRAHDGTVSTAALSAILDLPAADIAWSMLELANLHLVTERANCYAVIDLVRVHARGIQDDDATRNRRETHLLAYYDCGLAAADTLIAPNRPWRNLLWPSSVFPGPGTGEFAETDAEGAREWLRREHDNILAAAKYAFDIGRYQLVVRWCVLLWPFQEQDKRIDAMLTMHDFGVPAVERSGMTAAASFLQTQRGFPHYWRRAAAQAAAAFERGLQAARSCPSSPLSLQLEASALEGLGLALLVGGLVSEARITLRHNFELARRIDDERRLAIAALHLAKVEPPQCALELLALTDAYLEHADEPDNRAKALAWRGRKLLELGPGAEAERLLTEALAIMRHRRRRFDEAEILVTLSECAAATGDSARALEHYRAARNIYAEWGFHDLVATVDAAIRAAGLE